MVELTNENFELDWSVVSKTRKTIQDHVKASTEVRGDMVEADSNCV